MRTSEQIKAEIEEKFGFVPPFFGPAEQNPQVLENLWQQTLSAYVNNPLPTLFKEKLSAYLSRYCAIPYCMICHSCSLRPLGMKAREVLELLESPSPIETDIDKHLRVLAAQPGRLTLLSEWNSELEESLLACAIFIAMEGEQADYYRVELRHLLGAINYQHLVAFITYVKTCHAWMEAHPEVAYEADKRAQDHLGGLLEDEPGLADFFHHYSKNVRHERQSWAEQQAAIAERQRHEVALRQSEERLRLALEAAHMGTWDWDILTNKVTYSLNTEANFGLVPGSFDGTYQSFLNSVHPDDCEFVSKAVTQAVQEGTEYDIEFRVIWSDGTVHWAASKGQVYYDKTGKAVRMTGINMDITERKRADKALRESEERFRLLVEGVKDYAIYMLDPNGHIVSWNAGAERIKGYRTEEIIGQHFSSFYTAEDIKQGKPEQELKVAATEGRFEDEVWHVCKDGSQFWANIVVTALRDRAGNLRGFSKVTRDITERKRAEEKLRASEERFRRVAESNMIGILFADLSGNVTEANDAFLEMVGYTQEELLSGNLRWHEMTPSEYRCLDERAIAELRMSGVCTPFEKEYIRKNGSRVPVLIGVAFLEGSQDNCVAFVLDVTERQRAQEALYRREQEFKALLENTPDVIIRCNRELRYMYVNSAVERTTGMPAAAFIGKTSQELGIPQELCLLWDEALRQVFETGQEQAIEFQASSVSGLRNYQSRVVPEFHEGSIQYALVVSRDITGLKQAEKQVRESEERFQIVARATNDALWDWNLVTNAVWWNAGVQTLFHYSAEEVGLDSTWWHEHIHPEEQERVVSSIRTAIDNGRQVWSHEYRFRRGDGSYAYIFNRGYVVHDDKGKPVRMIGAMMDITDRKRTQEELQRSQLRSQLFADVTLKIRQSLQLEEILQTTVTEVQKLLQADRVLVYRLWPDGTGSVVTEAVVPGWPTVLEQTFPAEVFPEECRQLYRQGRIRAIENVEKAEVQSCLVEFLQQWGAKAKLVVPILLKEELWGLLIAHQCNSTRHWQSFEIELLRQLADQIGIALAQAQLLEQETRQRQELTRSNAELQQFASIASHDLQEPLRKIQAFGNRLKDKCGETLTDQGRDYLDRMQNAAERMQTLINDLLTLSRITTKAQPFVTVNLVHVTREVLSDLEVRIQQTGGRVEVGELPYIEADPLQMRQLLQNLVSNALKFHRDEEPPVVKIHGRFIVGQERQSAEGSVLAELCQIIVEDNGIGFDEKYLDRIFNVFQRLHNRSEYEGTGMGLTICRKIAERHSGSLTAESKPGQGATFIVTLPIKQRKGENSE